MRVGAAAGAVELGSAAAPVIRHGDTVSVGATAGVISLVSGTAEIPPAISKVKA